MSNNYTVFGSSLSGNCYKVALILKLTGKPHDWVETDVLTGATRAPEFLAMNPVGKVPVLRLPDGQILSESNAMLIYLAENSRYLPEDRYQRALVYQWLFYEQYSHEPYIAVARFLMKYAHGQDVDPKRMKMLHERGCAAFDVMNAHLEKQSFFAGAEFTIADMALYAYSHVAEDGGFDTSRWPAVSAWLERVSGQEGVFDIHDMQA